jgi:two-component system nitrogen regulation response regulator GlnG
MPAELQTRLLRVLSDGQFYRVGGHQPISANVRVIAATHQDLENRVQLGLFREDLFHRLNVIRLRLPALRERKEDIPILAKHFLLKSARDQGVESKRLSENALKYLQSFDWRGNVRQIENVCHWLTVMAPGQNIEINDLPPEIRGISDQNVDQSIDWKTALDSAAAQALAKGERGIMEALTQDFERTLILRALQHTGGRRVEAAQYLGLGRNTLTRKIQELGLEDGEQND